MLVKKIKTQRCERLFKIKIIIVDKIITYLYEQERCENILIIKYDTLNNFRITLQVCIKK